MSTIKKSYEGSPRKSTGLYWFACFSDIKIHKYPIFPLQSFFVLVNLGPLPNRL